MLVRRPILDRRPVQNFLVVAALAISVVMLTPPFSPVLGDAAARRVVKAGSFELDAALVAYFQSRKTFGEVIHRFFGDPGLQVAAARYAGREHQTANTRLRGRLAIGGIEALASALSPLERAELQLLAAAPLDFVSCIARRAQKNASVEKADEAN